MDAAGQSKVPETVEVNLVFPHNDTYAPVPFIPIVFAIQNFHASRSLFLSFYFKIVGAPWWNTTIQEGIMHMEHANYSNNASNLHFMYDWTNNLNNTKGHWAIIWDLYTANCTDTGVGPGPLKLNGISQRKVVYFSTGDGAQQPDLITATNDGNCEKTGGFTFNITQVLDVSELNRYKVHQDVCPIIASVAPTPKPCLAKVDNTAASSISYAIQSKACMSGLNSKVTCPPEARGESAAIQLLPLSLKQASWFVMALLGLANSV